MTEQQLVAVDRLMEEYELLLTEKLAIVDWLDSRMARLPSTDPPEQRDAARAVRRGLLTMRHTTLMQAETYREYIEGLRQRQREIRARETR